MEVFVAGFVNLIATVVLVALIAGALGGVTVWRVRSGLALGGLVAVTIYLLTAAVFLGFDWLALAVLYGVPSFTLTFLISFLAVRYLEARTDLHYIWATLLAFGSASMVGVLCLWLFRYSHWAPVWVVLGADLYLIIWAVRNRKLAAIMPRHH